jgi:uncharacterized membrane protein
MTTTLIERKAGAAEAHRASDTSHARAVFTILRSPQELYRFCRRVENLSGLLQGLVVVKETSNRISHWTLTLPDGDRVEWDAEITRDVPNEAIEWRTIHTVEFEHRGSVTFTPAPGGKGTEMRVAMEHESPPGGVAGKLFLKLVGKEPQPRVEEGLRRFKMVMEAGEIPTTAGQPCGEDQPREEP